MSKERSDAAKRPLDRRVRARDFAKWSTVILRPTFWWRVKSLFVAPEITFCWGEDEYTVRGLDGADFLSIGGVPDSVRSNANVTGLAPGKDE